MTLFWMSFVFVAVAIVGTGIAYIVQRRSPKLAGSLVWVMIFLVFSLTAASWIIVAVAHRPISCTMQIITVLLLAGGLLLLQAKIRSHGGMNTRN
jgi:drug/metabolite transporter (DMT)-like permease